MEGHPRPPRDIPEPPRDIPEFDTWWDADTHTWRGRHRYSDEQVESRDFDLLEILAISKRTAVTLRKAARDLAALRDPRTPGPSGPAAGGGGDSEARGLPGSG